MKLRVFVVVWAILVGLHLQGSSAYHLLGGTGGFRWTHPITYCADPRLQESMRLWEQHANIPDGGVSTTPDISCTVEPLAPGLGGYSAPFLTGWDTGVISSCAIHINSQYQDALVIWVHELGHCLGLAHSCEDGQTNCTLLERQAIMNFDGGVAGINADDEAGIQALYGPPKPPPSLKYRLVSPDSARD